MHWDLIGQLKMLYRTVLVRARESGYTVGVCGILALLFIVVPAIEIFVLLQVGSALGALATFGIILVTGLVGAALAKHQGLMAVRRVQVSLLEGKEVGASMIEAALVLIAGVLMLTPGFVTDFAGLALLLGPVRRRVAALAAARYRARAGSHIVIGSPLGWGAPHQDMRGRDEQARRDRGVGRREDENDHDPPPPGVIDI